MKSVMDQLMDKWGTKLIWFHDGAAVTLRGFFQPVTSRSWQKLRREVSPLGEASTLMYVYLGPVDQEICEGDQLEVAGKHYVFRKTELIYDRDGPVYRWGLCTRKGRELD